MESSIRKNWLVAAVLIALAVLLWHEIGHVRDSLRIIEAHNDLKWIGFALHEYHDRHGSFPPSVVRDEHGNAIHSWRSIIDQDLNSIVNEGKRYRAYDFSSPWNSKANSQTDAQRSPGDRPYQFLTVVDPRAVWNENGSRSMKEITDGTSHTLLAIGVRDTGVKWHQPLDATMTVDGGLEVDGRRLDLSHDFFVLLADGSVRHTMGLAPDVLSALLTIDGNEKLPEW